VRADWVPARAFELLCRRVRPIKKNL